MTNHETTQTPVAEMIPPSALEMEEQKPAIYGYDPSRVATLNAQQMDEIEARAWQEADDGVSPDEVQAHIYDAMTKLGFDLTQARDNGLAIKFEGVDGKSDVRVINLSSNDFGVRIHNAQLAEVAQDQPEQAEEGKDEELDREVNEFGAQFGEVKSKLANSLEQASGLQYETTKSLSDIMQGGQMLLRKLEQRQEFRNEAMQLEELIGRARTKVRASGEGSETVNRDARAAVGIVDYGSHLVTKGGESAAAVGETVRRARHDLQQLHNLQGASAENTGTAMRVLGRLDNIIQELRYSRHGVDAYADELRQTLRMVGETGQMSQRVRSGSAAAAEAFRTMS